MVEKLFLHQSTRQCSGKDIFSLTIRNLTAIMQLNVRLKKICLEYITPWRSLEILMKKVLNQKKKKETKFEPQQIIIISINWGHLLPSVRSKEFKKLS